MKYESTKRVQSKLPEFVGVAFVLRKMNVFRRDELEEIKVPFIEKARPLREELEPLIEAYQKAIDAAKALVHPDRDKLIADGMPKEEAEKKIPLGKIDFPEFKRWLELTNQLNKIDRAEQTPAMIRYVLVRIEGLEIDGEEATFDTLLKAGTDELYAELANEVARELGLLPEEVENLKSPSTLVAVEGGDKTTGSADPAEIAATTSTKAA